VILTRFISTKQDTVDARICDFDDTQYHVVVTADDKNTMKVSAAIRGAKQILTNPLYRTVFDEYLGKYSLAFDAETNYDMTLTVPLDALPESPEAKEALALVLSRVKRHVMGAPLTAMGRALDKKTPLTDPLSIEVRMGEFIYYVPMEDRVTVVFDVGFKDPTDLCISKVFLLEFNEMRRHRELASAPQPLFMTTPPQEITRSPQLNATVSANQFRVGYLSFGIQPRHIDAKSIDNTVDRIVQFRAYIHYHIKCSKSLMHTRMRKRVESLLQVLNRAIPDVAKDSQFAGVAGQKYVVAVGGAAGL